MKMRNGLFAVVLLSAFLSMFFLPASGQRPRYDKLSPMLRHTVHQHSKAGFSESALRKNAPKHSGTSDAPKICTFVKIADGGEEALLRHGCKVLTRVGDICIASIPTTSIASLSLESSIVRMEAQPSLSKGMNQGNSVLTDSMALHTNALPVYEGKDLPQAYTGDGVVLGLMDIGFDLTHPNFFVPGTDDYRISRLWDMLSADTVGSPLYVGRDYIGREELLALRHCRDGEDQHHGTHTLGIAAGGGHDTRFRGMAPEADICLVANAVSDDIEFIDSTDYEKYTFATDALGFKYIFDYAESQNKPCVISFSEGSGQDFWGYDLLYYEMLEKLTGPGRIIVSAAGNNGQELNWFRKPTGTQEMGIFMVPRYTGVAAFTLKADKDFVLRLVTYRGEERDTLLVRTSSVTACEDSLQTDSLFFGDDYLQVETEAYPSCYDSEETCFDVVITASVRTSQWPIFSMEVIGDDACVEAYRVYGIWGGSNLNPLLSAGENTHSILSPASSPHIICVGNNGYSGGRLNYQEEWRGYYCEGDGLINRTSSVGPTFDGRIKPDVVAPGMNIVSSMNSFYEEKHHNASICSWDVLREDYKGRTYGWCLQSGTSMSCPAVAGAIALWLQAKPDLTMEQVMDVFSHTCRQPEDSLSYPNNTYGYGEIDVYRGLLYILGCDGIDGVSTHHTPARIELSGGQLTIDLGRPLEKTATISIYSLSGRQMLEQKFEKGVCSQKVCVQHLPAGVCIVQIAGPSDLSGSTLIRL